MKLNLLYLVLLCSFLFNSCKNDKSNSHSTNSNISDTALKDISELSYLEIYHALFTDNNGGFDAHGDLYGQDAISSLSFTEEPSSCDKALFLFSSSVNDTIMLALKASFNFPGNPNNEMVRAYSIHPNGKISIGNSKLCYNGKEYDLKREIISAGFINN